MRNGKSQQRKLGALPKVRRTWLMKKMMKKATKKKMRRKRTPAPAKAMAWERRKKTKIRPQP